MAEQKRPGRPPVDANDHSVYVGVTLPAKQYDALCVVALRHDVSVPEVIRQTLQNKKLKTPR